MTLTVADAARRRLVRLPNGQSAVLISVPGDKSHKGQGSKALVQLLHNGKYLRLRPEDLDLLVE